MKHILISKEKNQYVANLHCHTTLSDGRKTPEEIRDAYKEQGYSIVAFSDHDNYFDHSDFCTDDFVAINKELEKFSKKLIKKPMIRILSKMSKKVILLLPTKILAAVLPESRHRKSSRHLV